MVGVITAAFVFLKTEPKGESQQATAITRLRIPAALAADAFDIQIEKNDGAAAAVDTTFKVTSKVDIAGRTVSGFERFSGAVSKSRIHRRKRSSASRQKNRSSQERSINWPSRRSRFKTTEQNATAISHGQFKPLIFSASFPLVPGDGIGGVPIDTGIEVTLCKPVGKIRARSWNLIKNRGTF